MGGREAVNVAGQLKKTVLVCQDCRNRLPQAGNSYGGSLLSCTLCGWNFKTKVSAGLVTPQAAVLG